MPHLIEPAPTARAKCRGCGEKAGFLHVPCASGYFETAEIVPRLVRFSPGLTGADLQEIQAELLQPSPPAAPAASKAGD